MNASATAVFEYCCRKVGFPLDRRGAAFRCPFCRKKKVEYKLGISDEKRAWKCHIATCPGGKGGYFDIPVAFGFASDRKEAGRWLASVGLVDRAIPSQSSGKSNVTRVSPVAVEMEFINPKLLPEFVRDVWREAQLDLRSVLPWEKYLQLRDIGAKARPARSAARRKKFAEALSGFSSALRRDIACKRARDAAGLADKDWCLPDCPCAKPAQAIRHLHIMKNELENYVP